MGYSHYFYTKKELDSEKFMQVASDFKKMVTPLKHLGVILADGWGENTATISPTEIIFNGVEKCGHEQIDLGIAWPGKNAKGVSNGKVGQQLEELSKDTWFAGRALETRACGGDCSHETFSIEQKNTDEYPMPYENDMMFGCVKTAYKPYDLAVNICLVIAKHYFDDSVIVKSDGDIKEWQEAMDLCDHFLGYGLDFKLDRNSPKEIKQ